VFGYTEGLLTDALKTATNIESIDLNPIFAHLYHYNSMEIFSRSSLWSFVNSTTECDPFV
jgi:hypothetical protein